jgi:hypothetical protein
MHIYDGAGSHATLTWVANQAVYVPITIPFSYPVRRVFWGNGSTASSNVDFGIYRPDGTKVYSTGSVAQSGASVPQYVTPTAFSLPAGDYFFGLCCDGTTSRLFGYAFTLNAQRLAGVMQQAVGAVTLPDPAVFATADQLLYPHCGVTWTTTADF